MSYPRNHTPRHKRMEQALSILLSLAVERGGHYPSVSFREVAEQMGITAQAMYSYTSARELTQRALKEAVSRECLPVIKHAIKTGDVRLPPITKKLRKQALAL